MAVLKKYDLNGKSTGEVEIADSLLQGKISSQLVKDYLVALHANKRQWSAHTKGRGEVNKAKQKAQAQKGLGRARHGMLSAPQFRKGGVVHGPKAKFNQHVKINRKAKKAVICSLIVEKVKEQKAVVLTAVEIESPKTKLLADFFKKTDLAKDKVLVLASKKNDNLFKSLRNLPKKNFFYLNQINGFELANCQKLVFLDSAMVDLDAVLKSNKSGK